MLLVKGTVRRVQERERDWTSPEGQRKQWTETEVTLLSDEDVYPERVTLSKDFNMATCPKQGDEVVMECWAKGSGKRVYLTGVRVIESRAAAPSVKAV